ncbi:hypothetical protein AVEN_175188-1 [Araneus ventricosus]|uniref:Uncharacterized protein n=1 Tax=Araneus ventricosus TaxID=182803 RepID=A0A4Y2HHB6_ARAVE|nr:hypothetical protein AVEN_175188-1 [Araneus ventricosus]
MRNCVPSFIKIAKHVNWPICYIILENLDYPALRDWDIAYLPLQYFKKANEEPVYRVLSKSPCMSASQFVTYILETLSHPALRAWDWAYLFLHYGFRLAGWLLCR